MPRLQTAYHVLRHMGPRWVAYRGWLAAQQRFGWLERRMSKAGWDDRPLADWVRSGGPTDGAAWLETLRSQPSRFFFSTSERASRAAQLLEWDRETGGSPCIEESENVAQGRFRFFAHEYRLIGCPPDWHRNPETGQTLPATIHWSRIATFKHGDIKLVWEPSRFAWTYALVRAYWRTGDARWPELFWRLVEDWHEKNPPNTGPNWMCGQETALRLMAWCFGLFGFLDAEASTPARVGTLVEMLAVSGERIARHIGYALSQQNNHGVSEANGLWTLGLFFPELRAAAQWREKGRACLERSARELIYDDGSFSQHSTNYHRVMLHGYLWAIALGNRNGQPLSDTVRTRVGRAVEWVYQLQDDRTGCLPNCGANDGALVLPLSNCGREDCRPLVQCGAWLTSGQRWLPAGRWDEELFWLAGPASTAGPRKPRPRSDYSGDVGGHYTLRSPQGFALVRCARFHHRPGHADQLHVDLWWRGVNVALDAGTFSYNAAPWDTALSQTDAHNTVSVDGLDQMDRASRFLWLPWSAGRRCPNRSLSGIAGTGWEGEHNGYERLKPPVTHRRWVSRLGQETWLVIDRLASKGPHTYRLHWLLADVPIVQEEPDRLRLDTTAGPFWIQRACSIDGGMRDLVRADVDSPRGWWCPGYNSKAPAHSWAMTVRGADAVFWTLLSGVECRTVERAQGWIIQGPGASLLVRRTVVGQSLAEGVKGFD